MSFKVGMPTMFLGKYSAKSSKKKGNARAVLCECLKERHCSDPDIDRSRTKDNIYLTNIQSGNLLADQWEQTANDYTYTSKDGKAKKLRSDAHIGFAGIVKPTMDNEEYANLSERQKIQFCKDAFNILIDVYKKYGIYIDYGVIHLDEQNPHLHYGGHDDNYQLAKKLRLKLYNDLNRGEFVKRMQAKGWNIQPLAGYDKEIADKMSADELAEYKSEHIKHKKAKKHGRSSKEYKAEQEAQAIKRKAEAEAQAIKKQAELDINAQKEALRAREQLISKREAKAAAFEISAQIDAERKARAIIKDKIAKFDDFTRKAVQEKQKQQAERLRRTTEVLGDAVEMGLHADKDNQDWYYKP